MDPEQTVGVDKFPHVSEVLLKTLDNLFPLRSPDPEWNDKKIWIEVGQRRVIDFLSEQNKIQNENVLR